MATITSKITVGKVWIIVTDSDPSISDGTDAPTGSTCYVSNGGGIYIKNSETATDWIKTDVGCKYNVTIDSKLTGSTLIGTPPRNFIVTRVVYYAANISELVSLPTFAIGTNSPNYNNIVAAGILTVISNTNDVVYANILSAKGYVPANTGIYVNNSVAAVGTAVNITIDVLGYFK